MGGGGPPGRVSHTFSLASSSVYGAHPHAFVCPYFHQRGRARGGHPCFDCQECCGACSSSISRLLQPPVCRMEDLGVVETGHRPVSPQPLCGRFTLPHGDRPVCSSVCPSGIGWPPSTFGKCICRFLSIQNLIASSALWRMAAPTSSERCVLVCPRPLRSSLGLWLLFLQFFIP